MDMHQLPTSASVHFTTDCEHHKLYQSIIEGSQPNEEQTAPHAVASAVRPT